LAGNKNLSSLAHFHDFRFQKINRSFYFAKKENKEQLRRLPLGDQRLLGAWLRSRLNHNSFQEMREWEQRRASPSCQPGGGEALAKLRVLSTHLWMNQRLHPGLLELAGQSGAQAVELFAARQHFDYTSREHIAGLAAWFRSNPLEAWSMHAPLYPDREMGRSGAPSVNLLHPEKARRIAAMDEIKRALESAEQIPFRNLVVHLGERNDEWSPRTIEYALTALEHLGAFARPLGVNPLVENLTGDPTTPEHLMEILAIGHLDSIGACLDLGHAHMTVGIPQAIGTFGARIVQVHAHDNHGLKDEHLWPGEGNIDWPATAAALNALTAPPAVVLELTSKLPGEPATLPARIQKAFELLG
jgi:sugar phosphate isomerase/epimerase